jgi:hypothetical protein
MKISSPDLPIDIEPSQLPASDEQASHFKELMQASQKKEESKQKDLSPFFAWRANENKSEKKSLSSALDILFDEASSLENNELCEINPKEKKKKKQEEPSSLAKTATPLFSTPYFTASTLSSLQVRATEPAAKSSPSEIFALMEKVGSEMIVMASEGSTKTTLILDNDVFGSTLLKDAKITIEEFSSAPKIFNVKITASPQAIEALRGNMEEFLKLFQERKFSFSINRIDTELSSSRPVFSRKENKEEDGMSDQQGSKRQ